MKPISFVVVGLLALSGAFASDSCYKDVAMDCSQASTGLTMQGCNALYGKYGPHNSVSIKMQEYANLHLERSFEYLLSAAYFNNYQTNREGFRKFFQKLSNDAWEKSIDLMKHITMRGDVVDFARRSKRAPTRNDVAELHELEALAKALDTQKEIAERAFEIHREATRNSAELHDPEITHYLEEEFIEGHGKGIREIAGYAADLKKFVTADNGHDLSLALYLFDEYLQKVV